MEDFILNGRACGDVAQRLMECNFDVNCLRPWRGQDGRSYITQPRSFVENGRAVTKNVAIPLQNAKATLSKDDWKLLDEAVLRTARQRLQAVADIRGAGLTYNVPNGMGKTILETQTLGDVGDAIESMDGLARGQRDRPLFELTNLPLPITHFDFGFSLRQILTSRNSGNPLDTTMAELASRKVSERVEKTTLGEQTGMTYGGGTVYGLTNFPNRITKTITDPTATGWTPNTTVDEVLDMKEQARAKSQFGPFMLYASAGMDKHLDKDYSLSGGNNPNMTLRDRLLKINGITDVKTLDFLSGTALILVQMTSDTIRIVLGMDITTVQWESDGGLQQSFKVMAIMVPQIRADQASQCGIVHGSV